MCSQTIIQQGIGLTQEKNRTVLLAILISLIVIGTPLVSGQSIELIEWHGCVKKNVIFAWKATEVDIPNEDMAGFFSDLLIQMKFIKNPPNDASRIFNATEAPDWIRVYINGFNIDLDMMGGIGTAFTQLLSPISFQFDNGTSFTLEEMHRLATPNEGLDVSYTVDGGYVNATIGNETMRFTTFTNVATGIAKNVSMVMGEMGSFLLEYYAQAANVNEDGESTEIEDNYTEFQDDPFTTFRNQVLIVVAYIAGVIIVVIFYRRKS